MNQDVTGAGRQSFSGKQVIMFILVAILATMLLTYFAVKTYLFPARFEPVTLSEAEERRLNEKLAGLEILSTSTRERNIEISGNVIASAGEQITPQAYTEKDASREVLFSERELNALLASNTEMASKLAIDLSDNLASAKLLIPLDADFPVMGGKTLRLSAGVRLSFTNGRPVVELKGVSVMGMPIPNAWLGNLKNVDLVREFGADEGFWKAFAAGVDLIEVKEGRLRIRLKE